MAEIESQQQFVSELKQVLSVINESNKDGLKAKRSIKSLLVNNRKHLHGSFIYELRNFCLQLIGAGYLSYGDFLSIFSESVDEFVETEKLVEQLEFVQPSKQIPFRIRIVDTEDDSWYRESLKRWACIPQLTNILPVIDSNDYQLTVIDGVDFQTPDTPFIRGKWSTMTDFAVDVGKKALQILRNQQFKIKFVGIESDEWYGKVIETVKNNVRLETYITPVISDENYQLIVLDGKRYKNSNNIPVIKGCWSKKEDLAKAVKTKILEIIQNNSDVSSSDIDAPSSDVSDDTSDDERIESKDSVDFKIRIDGDGQRYWYRSALEKWKEDSRFSHINPVLVQNDYQLYVTDKQQYENKDLDLTATPKIKCYWLDGSKFADDIGKKVLAILEQSPSNESSSQYDVASESKEIEFRICIDRDDHLYWYQEAMEMWKGNPDLSHIKPVMVTENYQLKVVDDVHKRNSELDFSSSSTIEGYWGTHAAFARDIGKKVLAILEQDSKGQTDITPESKKIDCHEIEFRICIVGNVYPSWYRIAMKRWKDNPELSHIKPVTVNENYQLKVVDDVHKRNSELDLSSSSTIEGYWGIQKAFARDIGKKVLAILNKSPEFKIKLIGSKDFHAIFERACEVWKMVPELSHIEFKSVESDCHLVIRDKESHAELIPGEYQLIVGSWLSTSMFALDVGKYLIKILKNNFPKWYRSSPDQNPSPFKIRILHDGFAEEWYKKALKVWQLIPRLANVNVTFDESDCQLVVADSLPIPSELSHIPCIEGNWWTHIKFAVDVGREILSMMDSSGIENDQITKDIDKTHKICVFVEHCQVQKVYQFIYDDSNVQFVNDITMATLLVSHTDGPTWSQIQIVYSSNDSILQICHQIHEVVSRLRPKRIGLQQPEGYPINIETLQNTIPLKWTYPEGLDKLKIIPYSSDETYDLNVKHDQLDINLAVHHEIDIYDHIAGCIHSGVQSLLNPKRHYTINIDKKYYDAINHLIEKIDLPAVKFASVNQNCDVLIVVEGDRTEERIQTIDGETPVKEVIPTILDSLVATVYTIQFYGIPIAFQLKVLHHTHGTHTVHRLDDGEMVVFKHNIVPSDETPDVLVMCKGTTFGNINHEKHIPSIYYNDHTAEEGDYYWNSNNDTLNADDLVRVIRA